MTSLPLYSGENIIKKAAGVAIREGKYHIYLTNRRLILEGGGKILEFPLGQVDSVFAAEGTGGQPGIRIAVRLKSGDLRDLVLTFIQDLSSRSGERDDWISALGGDLSIPEAVPEMPRSYAAEVQPEVRPAGGGKGMNFCPLCGAHLPVPEAKFCPSCGGHLPSAGGAEPPVQQAPPPEHYPPVQEPGFPGTPPPSYDPLQPSPGGYPGAHDQMAPTPYPHRPQPVKKKGRKKAKPQKLPVRKTPKQKVMKKARPKRRDLHFDTHYSGGGIDPLYADASSHGKKITGFILHPRATFSACRYDSAGDALRYFLFVNVVFAVATVAWIFLLAGSAEASLFPRLAEIYNGGAEAFITTAIEMYVYGLVSVGFAGIMLHFALILSTGGSDAGHALRTAFYSGTAYGAAALIPVAGIIIGPLWLLLLEMIGVSESENISTGSAAIPVIISVVLIAVVLYVLHAMEIITFGLMRLVI